MEPKIKPHYLSSGALAHTTQLERDPAKQNSLNFCWHCQNWFKPAPVVPLAHITPDVDSFKVTPIELTPRELNPVVPVNGLDEIAVSSTCPRCGAAIDLPWRKESGTGREVIAWEPNGHCCHFQGAYSSGSFGTVQLRFR